MAEETKERWLNYLALSTVVLAVCATLSTFKGAGYSTRAVLSQTQAANQWAYYQSKSIKGYLYENQKESMELELKKTNQNLIKVCRTNMRKNSSIRSKIKTLRRRKDCNCSGSEKLESIRDKSQKHTQAFGLAVIFLQIAILLSSIAALLKKICMGSGYGNWNCGTGLFCQRLFIIY